MQIFGGTCKGIHSPLGCVSTPFFFPGYRRPITLLCSHCRANSFWSPRCGRMAFSNPTRSRFFLFLLVVIAVPTLCVLWWRQPAPSCSVASPPDPAFDVLLIPRLARVPPSPRRSYASHEQDLIINWLFADWKGPKLFLDLAAAHAIAGRLVASGCCVILGHARRSLRSPPATRTPWRSLRVGTASALRCRSESRAGRRFCSLHA